MYRGWTQIEYQNKHYDTDQKDDRRRDGGTSSTLRIKEQGTHLTLHEHDDDVTLPILGIESDNFLRIFPTKILPTIQFSLSQLHVPPIVAPHIPLL